MSQRLTKNSLNRRTVLKSAAWTAPVIAVATAAPTAAASGQARDLQISGGGGETVVGLDEDRTRYFEQGFTTLGNFHTVNNGLSTPAGSVFRVEWDSRLFAGSVEATIGDISYAPSQTGATGVHGRYAAFVIDQPIPAGTPGQDPGLTWNLHLGERSEDFFPIDEDLHPYTTLLIPPVGLSDPDLSNNGWSAEATYGGTWDVAVTVSTWNTFPVERTGEFPYTEDVRVPVAMTIVNNGPNVAPAESTSLHFSVPSAVGDLSELTNLQARLNGVSTPGAVAGLTGWGSSQILLPLQPGDELELEWDVSLPSTFPQNGYGLGTGGAGISGSSPGDVDTSNHYAIDSGV